MAALLRALVHRLEDDLNCLALIGDRMHQDVYSRAFYKRLGHIPVFKVSSWRDDGPGYPIVGGPIPKNYSVDVETISFSMTKCATKRRVFDIIRGRFDVETREPIGLILILMSNFDVDVIPTSAHKCLSVL